MKIKVGDVVKLNNVGSFVWNTLMVQKYCGTIQVVKSVSNSGVIFEIENEPAFGFDTRSVVCILERK